MLLMMATALMVVACAGVEDVVRTPEDTRPAEPQTVSFGAYVNRSTTRGGYQGTLTTTTLQNGAGGFGVFAYYTDNHLYNRMSLPNFMYNQQVTWNSGTNRWEYTPVKYWPNETGISAQSEGVDYLSFFAYAPFTEVNNATGCATSSSKTGIMELSRSIDTGDPLVRYYASMKPAEAVDLCWAAPYLNETKPDVDTEVTFDFHHALSALNVQIDTDVDEVSHDGTNDVDSQTRIYVRSITFRGFAERGQLNLNNGETTPRWNSLDCDCDLSSDPITIYDGRRDGREGASASLNELRTALNPDIVQSAPYTTSSSFSSTTPGVTTTAVNLFDVSNYPASTEEEIAAALAAPIYVLPTNEEMYVTIVYDVETYDPKLTSQYLSDGRTHGSTIENTISATIKNGSGAAIQMEAGKKYDIRLHLGITSVKVNASVTEWPTPETVPDDWGDDANVQLPN